MSHRERSTLIDLNLGIQTIKEAHGQTGWLETCARTLGQDSPRGQRLICHPELLPLIPELSGRLWLPHSQLRAVHLVKVKIPS